MLGMMNEAALALMVSVGHRTGLFDAMAQLPAATSAEIASAAGLDERYVREWLGAMTTGRITEHDAAAGTYTLPAGHAAWLTRAAGLRNMATGMQYIGLLGLVEDQIVDCFRNGGGVPYSAYPKFQAIRAEESRAEQDATLIGKTLPLVSGLTGCWPGSRPPCGPAGSTCASTPRPRPTSRTTWVTRWRRSCTRSPPCTA